MNTLCTYLIKQSDLVPDGVRAAGLAREANSPYERNMQERRRAREESERRAWEKLQNTLRTGQGYQDWMGEYFLDGLGLRNLKQLDDPRVQEYFLRKAEGKDPGNMHHIGLYRPAGFFKRRDSEGRLLNAAVEYIKNKRNAANANSHGSAQSVSTSTPAPAPAPTPKPAPAPAAAPVSTTSVATAPAPAGQVSPADSKTVETPAPASAPKKTNTPAGLTRDETMQFLRQGYVPNSAGGFMLNEDAAANALRRMEADPNLNLGSSITDASRLSRIRNNMLNNPEYTAQARQQEADDMLYSQAMYHKQRQDAIAAKNNAALEQHRGKLTNDARADYLRRGELDYQRSISTGAPLTPAAQWYQTYSNAEIDGNPLPDLPAQVQNGIEQGVHKFRGQLAAQQAPVTPAPLKTNNPYVITQKNMDANARAYAANNSGREALNTVNNVWNPERLKAAQERHTNAISGKNRLPVQPAQPVQPTTPVQPAQPDDNKPTVNPVTSPDGKSLRRIPSPGTTTAATTGANLNK
jgi:hypothetical protein